MMTIDETAMYANVCRCLVYKLIKQGRLYHTKIGRRSLVSRASVDAMLGLSVAA
jgi:excisionase family DNA binding protein